MIISLAPSTCLLSLSLISEHVSFLPWDSIAEAMRCSELLLNFITKTFLFSFCNNFYKSKRNSLTQSLFIHCQTNHGSTPLPLGVFHVHLTTTSWVARKETESLGYVWKQENWRKTKIALTSLSRNKAGLFDTFSHQDLKKKKKTEVKIKEWKEKGNRGY